MARWVELVDGDKPQSNYMRMKRLLALTIIGLAGCAAQSPDPIHLRDVRAAGRLQEQRSAAFREQYERQEREFQERVAQDADRARLNNPLSAAERARAIEAEARWDAMVAARRRERWAREVLAREAVLERMRNAQRQRQPDPAAADEIIRRPGQQPRQTAAGSDI